jgi:hypothetical protein
MFLRADEMLPVGVEREVVEAGLRQGLKVALVGRQDEGRRSGEDRRAAERPATDE